jgi:phosphotriesterase-related protein
LTLRAILMLTPGTLHAPGPPVGGTEAVPLSTHASMHPVGLAQLALLREEGVDPARVIVGHCDTYLDADSHRAILAAGARVQFDTIGRTHINPDGRRADAVVELLRAGWGERLLLSSDRCYRSDLRAFGGAGYDVVFTRFFDHPLTSRIGRASTSCRERSGTPREAGESPRGRRRAASAR